MKLVVGLGNPGEQYARTRHNIGFMVLDELAAELSASWSNESKFKAQIAESNLNGEKVMLAKPQTFMNLSGNSIQKIMQFYKIAVADVWVVFDDVDVPFGRLRLRVGGGTSGHQGVKSTVQQIGEDFVRVKVGISLNDRSVEPSEVYVLKQFNSAEQVQLPTLIQAAAKHLSTEIIKNEPSETTQVLIQPAD